MKPIATTTENESLQFFQGAQIRYVWDEEKETYFFSVVDVVSALTDSDYPTARKYWKVLKGRLLQEGFESVTNCYQLKLASPLDGKKYLTDVADVGVGNKLLPTEIRRERYLRPTCSEFHTACGRTSF
ncbi:MAG: hypothetical protein MJZ59_04665 [Paludibacteraceae bacterium]|nr:hypothetical protein [Paludibacteraceae bacterium]